MPVDFSGKWNLVSSEGFEEYLRSIGSSEDRIKALAGQKASLNIKQTGDNDFTVSSGLLTDEKSYKVGTPFKVDINGTEVESIASWEGNKQVLTTTTEDARFAGKRHVISREIVGGKLVQKMGLIGGPQATRTYQKA